MAEAGEGDRDRCLCGTRVPPHWTGPKGVERGSCTACGLQLVRKTGEAWRQVRG